MNWVATHLDPIKSVVELLAILSALLFFLYKVAAGWHIPNLKIFIDTNRTSSTRSHNIDYLMVKLKLDKGGTDGINFHTIQLRIAPIPAVKSTERASEAANPFVLRLGQFHRLQTDGKDVGWDKAPHSSPLRLAAGDYMEFGELVEVERGVPLRIEAVVIATRAWFNPWRNFSQWRSSTISLPVSDPDAYAA